MALSLPDKPAQYFIDAVLLGEWDPADARGYAIAGGWGDGAWSEGSWSINGSPDPSDERFLPVARTIDNVGAVYPSLVIQYSNETSGGQSTYDFMTSDGPGQNRTGTLLATARAQDAEGDYTGDAATYSAVDANDIVVELIDEVEAVCQRRADAPNSEFETIGSQRGPDVPDDTDEDPPVRIAQCEIRYSWIRDP